MHLNLTNILKVKNCFLRCALVTSKGDEREALARVFPQCFSEQPHMPSRVLSQGVLGKAEGFGLVGLENEFDTWLASWCEILAENAFFFKDDFSLEDGNAIPDELWGQLENRAFGEEIFVEYKGQCFGVMINHRSSNEKAGFGPLKNARDKLWILLVPKEYIDLNS